MLASWEGHHRVVELLLQDPRINTQLKTKLWRRLLKMEKERRSSKLYFVNPTSILGLWNRASILAFSYGHKGIVKILENDPQFQKRRSK